MRIHTVAASVRYSQDTGASAWKTIELSAEATIDSAEDWQEAQATLYQQLAGQLRQLWCGVGQPQRNGYHGSESLVQPPGGPLVTQGRLPTGARLIRLASGATRRTERSGGATGPMGSGAKRLKRDRGCPRAPPLPKGGDPAGMTPEQVNQMPDEWRFANALLRGAPESQRNDTATRLAGYFKSKGHPQDIILAVLEAYAERCNPPMRYDELIRTVESVCRYTTGDPSDSWPIAL